MAISYTYSALPLTQCTALGCVYVKCRWTFSYTVYCGFDDLLVLLKKTAHAKGISLHHILDLLSQHNYFFVNLVLSSVL
jgi:hypothetical protein